MLSKWVWPLLVACVACATLVTPPEGQAPTAEIAEEAWERVLHDHVDDAGRVNFASLQADPRDLEKVVAHISSRDPACAPGPECIARHINTYNALAMYGVIRAGIPLDFAGYSKRLRFFSWRKFRIDGETQSLDDYETDVLRALGDARVRFAMNNMTVGAPRLLRTPYTIANLEDELQTAARAFLNDRRFVHVQPGAHRVAVSELLKTHAEDFIGSGRGALSLIAYINQYRDEKIPEDYALLYIPYDWTVNVQPLPQASQN